MLTVEDGAGMDDADSFVEPADADVYWSDRAVAAWAQASAVVREAALRRAADYLGMAYRWPGTPTNAAQALCWPRQGASDANGNPIASDAIPAAVKRAQILLGLEALSSNLLAGAEPGAVLTSESVKVGDLARTRQYATATVAAHTLPRFGMVDALLAGLGAGSRDAAGARSIPLVRA